MLKYLMIYFLPTGTNVDIFLCYLKKNVTKRTEDWFQITYIISKPDHVTCKYLSDHFVYLYRYMYIDY